jgi:uncharacterized protein (TIGR02996 family)
MREAVGVLLEALHADPADEAAWLALADALEEAGQPERAELTRRLRQRGDQTEPRVQELLAKGVLPCLPERTNSLGMRFVLIPAGTFLMGSPDDEGFRGDDEGPVHEVEITRPFYLGVHPVTQAQWQAVMGSNPSYFSAASHGGCSVKGLNTDDFPVERVSWNDATVFLKALSALKKERESGRNYRLPTEAEWEYSCRGGASSYQTFHFGNSLCSTQANIAGNFPYGGAENGPNLGRTCEVGSYPPNGFGLYDMHGNVKEWCADWYDEHYYASSPRCDPQGPVKGAARVFRGGSRYSPGWECRSACRSRCWPDFRRDSVGFRVALVPSDQGHATSP